jgi:hypothetical protein
MFRVRKIKNRILVVYQIYFINYVDNTNYLSGRVLRFLLSRLSSACSLSAAQYHRRHPPPLPALLTMPTIRSRHSSSRSFRSAANATVLRVRLFATSDLIAMANIAVTDIFAFSHWGFFRTLSSRLFGA